MYHVARTTNTVSALLSGNPKQRTARRGKNVMLGRALARGGFWRRLWR